MEVKKEETKMKKWYASKSVWLNILAVVVTVVQAIQGEAWINPEYQVFILAVLNAIVRLLTNTSISGTPGTKA